MTQAQLTQNLMGPVWLRAEAKKNAPNLRFVDKAAEHLVSTLGQKLKPNTLKVADCKYALQRCVWVDGCVKDVLERYPDALGVELGAGLSTRFHRLSARISWPRFEWVDMNTLDVASCVWPLIPPTDNYRVIGCDQKNWMQQIEKTPRQPLVVVYEHQSTNTCTLNLSAVLEELIRVSKNEQVPVFLVAAQHRKRWWMLSKKRCDIDECLKKLSTHTAFECSNVDSIVKVHTDISKSNTWIGLFLQINA